MMARTCIPTLEGFLSLSVCFLFNWSSLVIASVPKTDSWEFEENVKFRNMAVSRRYLLSSKSMRSRMECAIACGNDARCNNFKFEQPTSSCSMYSDLITGACQVPSNVSSVYYSKLGWTASWVMVVTETAQGKTHVYYTKNKTWELTRIRQKMYKIRMDPNTWRLYWFNLDNNFLISSDLKGNDQIILKNNLIGPFMLSLDAQRGLLYYGEEVEVNPSRRYFACLDLNSGKDEKLHEHPKIDRLFVLPDLEFIFWLEYPRLRRRHYNSKTIEEVPGFSNDMCFSVDQLENRLLWITHETHVLVSTNAWGGDVIQSKLPKQVSGTFQLLTRNGLIYMLGEMLPEMSIRSCDGNFTEMMVPKYSDHNISGPKSLLWIPEHIYRNV